MAEISKKGPKIGFVNQFCFYGLLDITAKIFLLTEVNFMMSQHTFASIMFLASGVKVLQSIFDWLMFSTEAEIPAEMDLLYVQTTLGWVFFDTFA